jgi:hypothetical protein
MVLSTFTPNTNKNAGRRAYLKSVSEDMDDSQVWKIEAVMDDKKKKADT